MPSYKLTLRWKGHGSIEKITIIAAPNLNELKRGLTAAEKRDLKKVEQYYGLGRSSTPLSRKTLNFLKGKRKKRGDS